MVSELATPDKPVDAKIVSPKLSGALDDIIRCVVPEGIFLSCAAFGSQAVKEFAVDGVGKAPDRCVTVGQIVLDFCQSTDTAQGVRVLDEVLEQQLR